mmetsp:Transcript_21928/g.32835  ORF Transcript_21928/g.32835 Transcript_21928/m.32835 type:complete len:224 (-) Transcript_21928:104-775(-)
MGLLKKIFKRKRGAAKAVPTTNATGRLSFSSSNEAQSTITTGPGDDENESQLTQSAAPPLDNNKRIVIDAINLETLLSTLTDKDKDNTNEEGGDHDDDDDEQELCQSSFSIESGMDSQSQGSQSNDDASSSTISTQKSETAMKVLYRYVTSCNKPVSTFAMIDDMSSVASASISDDGDGTDNGQGGHKDNKHYDTAEKASNEKKYLTFSFLDNMCSGNTGAGR